MSEKFEPVLIGGINGVMIAPEFLSYTAENNRFLMVVYDRGNHYTRGLTLETVKKMSELLSITSPMTSVGDIHLWMNTDCILAPFDNVCVHLLPEARAKLRLNLGYVLDILNKQQTTAEWTDATKATYPSSLDKPTAEESAEPESYNPKIWYENTSDLIEENFPKEEN